MFEKEISAKRWYEGNYTIFAPKLKSVFIVFNHFRLINMNKIEKNNVVLLLVDIQGALAELMSDRERLFRKVNLLAQGADLLGIPKILTEQIPAKLGETRTEVAGALSNAYLITKSSFSCCGEAAFLDMISSLREKQVLLCGIETHICVLQTGLDLLERGYEVFVVRDAVASRDGLDHDTAIDRLQKSGACIVTAEMSLYELLQTADCDEFKDILKLVKSFS